MTASRRHVPLLLFCLFTTSVAAQEWPRFRGPDGGGVNDAASIPAKWDGGAVRWKVPLPGVGHSSPVVWGERVFVTCADEQSGTTTLACLAAADGKPLWKRDYAGDPYRHHGENSYASSSPAADAQRVYVCLMSPKELKVVALRHDGSDAWEAPLGPFVTQHGGGHSPVVLDGLVVVANEQDGPGSCLVALDASTGAVKWKTPRRSYRFSASTPCVYRPAGAGGAAQLVFTSWAHGMTGVNPADGSVLWEAPGAFEARTVGSPVAANDAGLVLASCGEGGGGRYLAAVRPAGKPGSSAEVAYKVTRNAPYVPTPLVKGGLLFFVSDGGTATCARVATGETVWQERLPGGGFFASPVCAGGKLYCVSKRGDVVVLSASEKFELLAHNELGEKTHATPAVAGDRMYLRTQGHLYCVGGK
jgi:outer membrane protein assembly factor BamB